MPRNKRMETIELEEGKGYVIYFEDGISSWRGFDSEATLDGAVKLIKRIMEKNEETEL